MKILVIGQGGREHAISWKAIQSPHVDKVFVAPGNAGTALEPRIQNVNISATNTQALLSFAQTENIALTIVGPETPLVMGIVDEFRAAGLKIFGPTRAAAQLEGSKTFAKAFLTRHKIPTADYRSFTDIDEALAYIAEHPLPIVIKADGLAAGKGVVIAHTHMEAEESVRFMLAGNILNEAGHRIVIEEFLKGEEASFIVMVDENHVSPLASSQDYKRVGDQDTGPNTGGMGAYSPAAVVTDAVHQRIMDQIIYPTVRAMALEGRVYTGFLYAGIMIDENEQPKVVEFNCRLGDPETQPLMLRLKSDIVDLCLAACDNNLNKEEIEWDDRPALGVVLAASGYPGDYKMGDQIQGIPRTEQESSKVFHAGTKREQDKIVTNGGRVLCVSALGHDLKDAQKNAYAQVKNISWAGCFYRQDIGDRAVKKN